MQDVVPVPTCGQPHEQFLQVYNQTSLKNRDGLFSEFSNPCSVITGRLGKTTNTAEQISRSLPCCLNFQASNKTSKNQESKLCCRSNRLQWSTKHSSAHSGYQSLLVTAVEQHTKWLHERVFCCSCFTDERSTTLFCLSQLPPQPLSHIRLN